MIIHDSGPKSKNNSETRFRFTLHANYFSISINFLTKKETGTQAALAAFDRIVNENEGGGAIWKSPLFYSKSKME